METTNKLSSAPTVRPTHQAILGLHTEVNKNRWYIYIALAITVVFGAATFGLTLAASEFSKETTAETNSHGAPVMYSKGKKTITQTNPGRVNYEEDFAPPMEVEAPVMTQNMQRRTMLSGGFFDLSQQEQFELMASGDKVALPAQDQFHIFTITGVSMSKTDDLEYAMFHTASGNEIFLSRTFGEDDAEVYVWLKNNMTTEMLINDDYDVLDLETDTDESIQAELDAANDAVDALYADDATDPAEGDGSRRLLGGYDTDLEEQGYGLQRALAGAQIEAAACKAADACARCGSCLVAPASFGAYHTVWDTTHLPILGKKPNPVLGAGSNCNGVGPDETVNTVQWFKQCCGPPMPGKKSKKGGDSLCDQISMWNSNNGHKGKFRASEADLKDGKSMHEVAHKKSLASGKANMSKTKGWFSNFRKGVSKLNDGGKVLGKTPVVGKIVRCGVGLLFVSTAFIGGDLQAAQDEIADISHETVTDFWGQRSLGLWAGEELGFKDMWGTAIYGTHYKFIDGTYDKDDIESMIGDPDYPDFIDIVRDPDHPINNPITDILLPGIFCSACGCCDDNPLDGNYDLPPLRPGELDRHRQKLIDMGIYPKGGLKTKDQGKFHFDTSLMATKAVSDKMREVELATGVKRNLLEAKYKASSQDYANLLRHIELVAGDDSDDYTDDEKKVNAMRAFVKGPYCSDACKFIWNNDGPLMIMEFKVPSYINENRASDFRRKSSLCSDSDVVACCQSTNKGGRCTKGEQDETGMLPNGYTPFFCDVAAAQSPSCRGSAYYLYKHTIRPYKKYDIGLIEATADVAIWYAMSSDETQRAFREGHSYNINKKTLEEDDYINDEFVEKWLGDDGSGSGSGYGS